MEGEVTEKETAEEKESDDHPTAEQEEGKTDFHHQNAAGLSVDNQDLPIMHWEQLSLRIAELEKLEQHRRDRAKNWSGTDAPNVAGQRTDRKQVDPWILKWGEEEDDEGLRRGRVTAVSSRLYNHKNLQLCFTNNSDSDDEDEGANKKVSLGASSNGYHPSGLKQEVRVALRTLRDKLWAEQKEKEHLACGSGVTKRKRLEKCELLTCSVQQLVALKASLQQAIHDLNSELVGHLLVRDQLRTKQDAMLLDVQDLT